MKKEIFMALLMLFLPAVLHAQPVIHFQEISHSFGTISQADKAEHIFEFVNKGDQELVIEKVTSS
jgi:hypothetical protein